jgi:ureidoacrylate peracid hydrolase
MKLLDAEPRSLEVDPQRLALIVVEMQNAFISKGGMIDLWGLDISSHIIEPIRTLSDVARSEGMKVIYITHRYSPEMHESGGPHSANWYQESVAFYREHPEWRDKLIVRGTWGAEIIDELKPRPGDIVVAKSRHSAFFGTNLDIILKTYRIKYLAFVGAGTNVAVEAAIRDAYNLDYFPILVSDAASQAGPEFMQEATIFNVKIAYGSVTTTENILKVMHNKTGE